MNTLNDSCFRKNAWRVIYRTCIAAFAWVGLPAQAAQIDINGPVGSGAFGRHVAALPNGNFVVSDPHFNAPGSIEKVGAVRLYTSNGTLINSMTGTTANNWVGWWITVLKNGNFVVSSPFWDSATANDVGAVTFCSGISGCPATVTESNSLVGASTGDMVDGHRVIALNNGNYVVGSSRWDRGNVVNAGAATWGSGISGVSGAISVSNSLVGTSSFDNAADSVTALTNGNYVVASPSWDGAEATIGAVTWGNGLTGVSGEISLANSLLGSKPGDAVGRVYPLKNGHYVVASWTWDNGNAVNAGAVTWCDGTAVTAMTVSASNSWVGSRQEDYVGASVVELTTGDFVIGSYSWSANDAMGDEGAATKVSGSVASSGVVSAINSFTGAAPGDLTGRLITALSNGHYVVVSPEFDNGIINDVGAVTWRDGSVASSGTVAANNSIIGAQFGDTVGLQGVVALRNGNYVIHSPGWDNANVADAGAFTWANGAGPTSAVVSASNSLVAAQANYPVGSRVEALVNGNYVVLNPSWHEDPQGFAGAATWGNGNTGISGTISASNSLLGAHGVTALRNGHYIVSSISWGHFLGQDLGAVQWTNGFTGRSGYVSASTALVGSTDNDQISNLTNEFQFASGGVALPNGDFLVRSPYWDNGLIVNAGALTWGDGARPILGTINSNNSVLGAAAGGYQSYAHNPATAQLIVGQAAANRVSLFAIDLLFRDGLEAF